MPVSQKAVQDLPENNNALVVVHDGYSSTQDGLSIDSLEPYLEYKSLPMPVPGEGQVLIKVLLGNINPSDIPLHQRRIWPTAPRRRSWWFEGVGVVVDGGKGGEALIGMRVAFFVVANGSGAWAQYAMTDVTSCIPLRKDLRDEDAATLFVNPLTAIAMFEEVKKSRSKSFIMTAAASQLCKLMTGLAKEDGYNAISIIRHDEQKTQLEALGATHVLNLNDADFAKQISKVIREEKPLVMLDAVGDQISVDMFNVMPAYSRWMIYGKLSTQKPVMDQLGQLIFTSKTIEGFWLVKWIRSTPAQEQMKAIARVQALFVSEEWKTDIGEIVPLSSAFEDLPKALSGMNKGKIMIRP